VLAPPNLSLLLIMACFWLVYLLVRTQFLKPLGALLDQRERQIRDAREAFSGARQQLDEAITRCERDLAQAAAEAQKERATIRVAGEAKRRECLEEARVQGQERLAALAAELERSTREARDSLRLRGRDLSHELAERLLGRRIAV
jgi:F0F1-type ATP synthase membrane subunit b/b'